jgi:hypothetical protein
LRRDLADPGLVGEDLTEGTGTVKPHRPFPLRDGRHSLSFEYNFLSASAS